MLKYECDMCHEVNVPADTYGHGVVPNGKALSWIGVVAGQTVALEIMPLVKADDASHICGQCIKVLVKEMMAELWPEPESCICEYTTDGPLAGAVTYDEKCLAPGHAVLARMTDEELPGDSGPDSDVREVRAKPEVPESGTTNGTTTQPCASCTRLANQRPGRDCSRPGFHIYAY